MNREELQKKVLRNTVRIQLLGKTVGSGMLYVPENGEYAYVLTAAHIFNQGKYPVEIQCYSDGRDDGTYTYSVERQMVHFHDNYKQERDATEVQHCDAAIIEIPKRSWMAERACIYYGTPEENLGVIGYGYSGASEESDIRADNVRIESDIRDVLSDEHWMRTHLQGDFSLNQADRKGEIGGLSGTVLTAQGEQEIVAIGVICNTNTRNAVFGMVNVIDMTAFCELFAKLGMPFERREVTLKESEEKGWKSLRVGVDRHFVCRDMELDAIRQDLQQDNIIVLHGIGGIGKTELARDYAVKHQAEYACIYEVPCTTSILDGIAEHVEISGFKRNNVGYVFESNEEYGKRKLEWIQEQTSKVLFIFDDVFPKDAVWPQIAAMKHDSIVTSRWGKEAWTCRTEEIMALKGIGEQQRLFEQYLERELEEWEIPFFAEIANIVNGHTLTLQLIALQCNASDATMEEILEVLKAQGLYTEDENQFSYGNTQEERNMYGHIRAIWNFAALSETEGKLMKGLCLLPEQGITRREYQKWLDLSNLNEMNSLVKRGWIQSYQQQGKTWIYLHMVVSEVIYRELYRKKPEDVQKVQKSVLHELQNRSKEFLERLRYISYGEYMGKRLLCSLDSVKFLNYLSMEEENIRELSKAMEVLQRAKAYLQELDALETLDAADFYNNVAVVYQTGKELQSAYSCFEKARAIYQIYSEERPERYGFVLHNMARICLSWQKYSEAMWLEDRAEKWIRKGNLHRLGNIYDVRAECYSASWKNIYEIWSKNPQNMELKRQMNDEVLNEWECRKQAVELKEKYCPEWKNEIILSKSNRACTAAFLGKFAEAKAEIQEVLEFYKSTTEEDSVEVGSTYSRMCLVYEKCQEYEQAYEYGEQAVRILKKRGALCREELDCAESNVMLVRRHIGV